MNAQRYPLTWPTGWKRTPPNERGAAPFAKSLAGERKEQTWQDGRWQEVTKKVRRSVELNSGDAAERLEYQLNALGATDAILSTNQKLRLDGRPTVRDGEPSDPGAAVYFRLKQRDLCLACDRWNRVADNIAALAAHIDAIRRQDRYGVGSLDQAFAGYAALPAKGSTWRTTLGFPPDAVVTVADVELAFRARARTAHPDVEGGSHDAMTSLTSAKTEALSELRA